MNKLLATIRKDSTLLVRDKVGLTLMFVMPILLVLVITSIQNATFDLVNNNKVPMLLCNKDKGTVSIELKKALVKIGTFEITDANPNLNEKELSKLMKQKDLLVSVVIPADFSEKVLQHSKNISSQSLKEFGIDESADQAPVSLKPLVLYYNPVLQESFRQSVTGALLSAQQLVVSKQVLRTLYFSLNDSELPLSLEQQMMSNQTKVEEVPVLLNGSRTIPNATQHNIPAWTIFAMFFIVISLGSSVVKEKISGSSVRLKTLPTNYLIALISKQLVYLLVCLCQVVVIFSIGIWLFPSLGLPKLMLPDDLFGLLIVSVASGWCAVSYAICIGTFAQTQEQANGFGAVSIVLLAAVGGILVPSFAMPDSFHWLLKISPLHWCLESFYGLFLEGGKLKDILTNILPLFLIIVVLNVTTFIGLKRQKII